MSYRDIGRQTSSVPLIEKNCPREILNLAYAGAGVFGAFSSFPACYSRP
jgi:hypothetical protein